MTSIAGYEPVCEKMQQDIDELFKEHLEIERWEHGDYYMHDGPQTIRGITQYQGIEIRGFLRDNAPEQKTNFVGYPYRAGHVLRETYVLKTYADVEALVARKAALDDLQVNLTHEQRSKLVGMFNVYFGEYQTIYDEIHHLLEWIHGMLSEMGHTYHSSYIEDQTEKLQALHQKMVTTTHYTRPLFEHMINHD